VNTGVGEDPSYYKVTASFDYNLHELCGEEMIYYEILLLAAANNHVSPIESSIANREYPDDVENMNYWECLSPTTDEYYCYYYLRETYRLLLIEDDFLPADTAIMVTDPSGA